MYLNRTKCIKPFGQFAKKCSQTLLKIKPAIILRLKTINIVVDDNSRICSSCDFHIRTIKVETRSSEKITDAEPGLLTSPKPSTSAACFETSPKQSTSAGCFNFSPKPSSDSPTTSSSSQRSTVESTSDFGDSSPSLKKTLVTELNSSILLPI